MTGYRRTKTTVVSDSGEESIIISQQGAKVPSDDAKLTVGEVEKLTGTSKDTLRFYDEKGLLRPVRSGEGVANNRKLYGVDDLARLQSIQTLRAYDFSLEEIRRILDDGIDISEVMEEKLEDLRRREARLRLLILFAKFVILADDDLIEGLANGPASLEDLADHARETVLYEAALQKLDGYSEEDAAKALDDVRPLIAELLALDEVQGLRNIDEPSSAFFSWWGDFVMPLEDVGYLGFWAAFEDHSLVSEFIEMIGRPGDAGFIQMLTFLALLMRFAKEHGDVIAEAAELADTDIVAAIEKTQELVLAIASVMLGEEGVRSAARIELIDIAYFVLLCLGRVREDDELSEQLGLAGDVSFDDYAIGRILQVIAVMIDGEEKRE